MCFIICFKWGEILSSRLLSLEVNWAVDRHNLYKFLLQIYLLSLSPSGQRYGNWKSELVAMERYILKELGFDLYQLSEHPHKYILYFVKLLGGNADLSQVAWNYLNDSMRRDICLRYPAQAIACAALYMSARRIQFPLPEGMHSYF